MRGERSPPSGEPERPEEAGSGEVGPGLGGGDVLVACAVSATVCGAALMTVLYDEPPRAYVRLRALTAPWTDDPHALVGAVLAPALLGTFVMALAVRTRTPPLPLPRLAHGDTRGLPVLFLTATGLFLLVTGLGSWLAVMILS